ncbi:Coq4 family protein [Tumidithrix elongata RA019]|uniref:Coq4 family protein n=1 Tax=Tumidithrix elongata BACA0141 TaxID=2716417 RepID=A0AAW9Q1Q9_9CYAN|nr:Coq4 family protein [Tumidithrix elongata RA019]
MAFGNLRHNLDFLSTLKGVVALLRDPNQTESVYDIEDGLRHIKATELAVEFVKSKPGVAELFQERYLAPSVNIEALLQLPQESLGHAYASYIKDSGFDPNFFRPLKVEDDASYFLLRMRQTHDIWHIVAGFGTDVFGELGLKAFELAQTHRTMSAVLIAGGLLSTLFKHPEELDNLLNQIAIGYRLGTKAKPFLAKKWEENWERPLLEWRQELGVEPAKEYVP